jgi:hypothetical protein
VYSPCQQQAGVSYHLLLQQQQQYNLPQYSIAVT